MTKIGVVLSDFPVISETFIVDQIVGLLRRGFAVEIVCDRVLRPAHLDLEAEPLRGLMPLARPRQPTSRLLRAVHRRLPQRARWPFQVLADVASDVRLNRFDALLAHFGWTGQRLARSSALGVLRRPFATVLHGVDLAVPFNNGGMQAFETVFRHCALLLPVCEVFREMVVGAGADPTRVEVVPTGVDCASIPFAPRAPTPEGVRILTTGRLVDKKGVDDAIRALGALRGRRPSLGWSYEVIGDGPLRRQLEALAAECGVADRVRFLGAMPHGEVKRRLGSADLFLLPSRTAADGDMESMPVVLKEAMAAGLPVISTFHSGIPELITSGETGLLAPERDVGALSAHLEWAMDDPRGCEALARAARSRVEAQFDAGVINDRLAALLLDIVAGRTATGTVPPRPKERR